MNDLLQHPVFGVLATALVHSLWLFAIPVALSWLVTRRLNSAHHRYLSHLLTLLSWPLLFAFVLWSEWKAATGAWANAFLLEGELGTAATLELTDGLTRLGITSPRWTTYLVSAYLLGLLVSFSLMMVRYFETRRLRNGGLLPPPQLRELFAEIKARLVPGSKVTWRLTDRVSTVLVVGVIRPVILFPIGLVNTLSTAEVEAILRHELMHLHRYDPLWNAVQELCRAIFFYHPLVYWLCAQLDLEREYACDDAVVRQTDKKTYARALLRVADYSLMPKKPLTMAAINSSSFTQRIQRLFTPATASAVLARGGENRSYLLPPLAILPLFLVLMAGTFGENPYQLNGENLVASTPAEEVILTGKILGGTNGDPLIGATISTADGTGAITDFDGAYSIRLEAGRQKITISYAGYRSMVMQAVVTKDAEVDFQLFTDRDGVMKSMNGTFTFTLDASENSSEGAESFTIVGYPPSARTTGSSTQNGLPSDILVLVDGKRRENGTVEDIDPSTIEKINVVKDKDELFKLGYGSDFSGAILITLKK